MVDGDALPLLFSGILRLSASRSGWTRTRTRRSRACTARRARRCSHSAPRSGRDSSPRSFSGLRLWWGLWLRARQLVRPIPSSFSLARRPPPRLRLCRPSSLPRPPRPHLWRRPLWLPRLPCVLRPHAFRLPVLRAWWCLGWLLRRRLHRCRQCPLRLPPVLRRPTLAFLRGAVPLSAFFLSASFARLPPPSRHPRSPHLRSRLRSRVLPFGPPPPPLLLERLRLCTSGLRSRARGALVNARGVVSRRVRIRPRRCVPCARCTTPIVCGSPVLLPFLFLRRRPPSVRLLFLFCGGLY
jgi:hypothetical protein